jgi:hypothetical protein
MPYIDDDGREFLDEHEDIRSIQYKLRQVVKAKRKGAVNYVVSRIALGAMDGQTDYHTISDAINALRDAADEIQRRLLGPREDVAIAKNGDLPEYESLL